MAQVSVTRHSEKLRWVGKPVLRRDGEGKVTGETEFFSDFHLPNMLWASVLRSKHPHALIKKIDTTRAEALPGVVSVITHTDVPGLNRFGIVTPDQPVLCQDKVRYLGDAIAVVAAESQEIAERAINEIDVEYESLLIVTDPEEAMKPDAPKVHEKGNIYRHARVTLGNVDEGFRKAATCIERTYRTGRQMHMFLELEAGVGLIDEQGKIVLYSAGQSPYRDRMQVARALGISPDSIRVVSTPVGGAFGGKEEITVQIHLAILALKTKRPVKMVWSREESGAAGLKRHPMKITMKTGALRDGTLIANQVRIVSDTGAYASLGGTVLDVAIENSCGPYRINNIDIDAYCVYTNNGFAGAFRGFGAPQLNFAMESQMELLAEELGIDPLEIRIRNAVREGDVGPFGHRIGGSVGILETLERAKESEIWRQRHKLKQAITKPWIKRGVGIAAAVKGFGFGALPDFGAASIDLTPTGKFVVGVSCPEIGQGNTTAYAQIAAEALHCDISDIYIASADSLRAPDTGTASASMSLVRGGSAILAAAPKMIDLILNAASRMLSELKENLYCDNGKVHSRRNAKRSVTYAALGAELHKSKAEMGVVAGYNVPRVEKPVEGSVEIPHWSYMYATGIALVEVDTLTGATKVLKYHLIPEAGKVVNPQGFTGQCEGAVVQGLGFALTEDTLIEDGVVKTNNFTTYIIPTIVDIPEITVDPVETHDPTGPFGAKGLGEIGIIPVASSVVNAIRHATGVRLYEIPATPERVFMGVRKHPSSKPTVSG